jgi:hypothetical protein
MPNTDGKWCQDCISVVSVDEAVHNIKWKVVRTLSVIDDGVVIVADRNCPACHGSGKVISGENPMGEREIQKRENPVFSVWAILAYAEEGSEQASLIRDGVARLTDDAAAVLPIRWNDQKGAGLSTITVQFLVFQQCLANLGAMMALPEEDHPGRRQVLKTLMENLPKSALQEMMDLMPPGSVPVEDNDPAWTGRKGI